MPDHQPPPSAEVKERVELYTSTPSLGLRGLFRGERYFALLYVNKNGNKLHGYTVHQTMLKPFITN